MTSENTKALTNFVVNNPDLERLEALLAEFNIFETIGAIKQELRHSDFLGFLLDPAGNHNLGDAFLKRLLKRMLARTVNPPISAVEVDVMDLEGTLVRREWHWLNLYIGVQVQYSEDDTGDWGARELWLNALEPWMPFIH